MQTINKKINKINVVKRTYHLQNNEIKIITEKKLNYS